MANDEKTYNIDGKEYKDSQLPIKLKNYIIARQELVTSKVRHEVELEKIDVLTNYYNDRIKTGLEEINSNGSGSES